MNAERSLDIIVCTYAPDRLAFGRLMTALRQMERPEGWQVSFTLIDNNSPEPVAGWPEVQAALAAFGQSQSLVEKRQGVAFARQLGIGSTGSPYILFFDDDNDPAPDYLVEAVQLAEGYPSVGIWGAGEIEVEFTEPPLDEYSRRRLDLLGQKKRPHLEYACLRGGWYRCYPPAMGMLIRRDIVMAYLAAAEQGRLTAVSRTGRKVLGAEDAQMVFMGITMGFAAGVSPSLRLRHLIVPRKTTFDYLRQLAYGNGVSYAKAYYESYGEHIPEMHLPTGGQIRKHLVGRIWRGVRNRQRRGLILELAQYASQVEGNYLAMDEPIPPILAKLKAYLGLG